MLPPVVSVAADTFVQHSFGDRSYRLYVPDTDSSDSLSLVVMLHGCTQSSRQFASETGMNDRARKEKFMVIYPDQVRAAQRYRCWNFYESAQRERGRGEVALIRGMVEDVAARRALDHRRIYLAGFSGGAGMAVHLGVAYPDVFAAVAVHSGFEYGAADGVAEALAAMEEGGPDPQKTGREAYVEMGSRADAVPTVVIHGLEDEIVDPVNGRQAARQATQTLDLVGDGVDDNYIDGGPESVEENSTSGHEYSRREYRYEDGRLGVVEYRIEGMDHSWAGGSPEGAYVDPDAPDATRIIWEFFERHTLDRVDATPPS